MGKEIFISYRREDGRALARMLKLELEAHLQKEMVFLDLDNIDSGEKWPKKLENGVREASLILVIISHKWLFAQDTDGHRRLGQEHDWVTKEVELALELEKEMIPILLDNVRFPSLRALPKSIVYMADFQKFDFRFDKWTQDFQPLLERVKELIKWDERVLESAAEDDSPEISQIDQELPFSSKVKKAPDHPFVGPVSFREEEAKVFFGRSSEILDLHDSISNPERQLTLFFGPSGVGKSSLLFAGLLPRMQDHWNIFYEKRKASIGLPQGLKNLLVKERDPSLPTLILMDQVEEMYTNICPSLGNEEPDILLEDIIKLLDQEPNTHILLSFRKEFLSELQSLFSSRNISFLPHPLNPLKDAGILEAINGVARYDHLRKVYRGLNFEKGLPEKIRDDIIKGQKSHVGPMLQIQLRKMWDVVRKDITPTLTFDLYEQIKDNSLEEFLLQQISSIKKDYTNEVDSGLVLDLLHFFTTEKATAGEHTLATIQKRYDQKAPIKKLCQMLIDHYLVLMHQTATETTWRLVHDAFAPLIIRLFNNSDRPGQRAFRIIDSKQKDIQDGIDVDFSPKDIDTIRTGIKGMRLLTEQEMTALEVSEARNLEQKRQLQQNTQQAVNLFVEAAIEEIKQLQYEGALKKLMAAGSLIDENKQLATYLMEVAYFYNESGQSEGTLAICQKIVELQGKTHKYKSDLESVQQEGITRNFIRQLLFKLDEQQFEKLEQRYYPQMVVVKGGAFEMGHTKGETMSRPVHNVQLSTFRISNSPITFWQFGLYCKSVGRDIQGFSHSWGIEGSNPAINVRWYDCLLYANWLSEQFNTEPVFHDELPDNLQLTKEEAERLAEQSHHQPCLTGTPDWNSNGFRLPTEAEWEYAARGGRTQFELEPSLYAGDTDIAKVAWYDVNAKNRTHPTKQLNSNSLGLYDMSGNVWEWCWDGFEKEYYKRSPIKNPKGPSTTKSKVLRGGSYDSFHIACTVYKRYGFSPNSRDFKHGFRIAQNMREYVIDKTEEE
ncbi:MAG: SUMF1/EgtB/PvdO family nonheme iron enzyme [Bacteroidota bacterium]